MPSQYVRSRPRKCLALVFISRYHNRSLEEEDKGGAAADDTEIGRCGARGVARGDLAGRVQGNRESPCTLTI